MDDRIKLAIKTSSYYNFTESPIGGEFRWAAEQTEQREEDGPPARQRGAEMHTMGARRGIQRIAAPGQHEK